MRITLCGSTRFKEEYVKANTELSKLGHVIYTIAWAKEDHSGPCPHDDEIAKENLDLVHLDKILNSDCIIVLGKVDGKPYIGKSTRREIVWAQMHNKAVHWGIESLTEYNDNKLWGPAQIELPPVAVEEEE